MKAPLLLAPCLAFIVLLTGCTKNYYNPGTTFTVGTVHNSDWKFDNTTNSFLYSFSTPELDDGNVQSDAVVVALELASNGGGVYETIPEVYGGISYSYVYESGQITIYAQGADGTPLSSFTAGDMNIKVSILPSTHE